jgi:hypothetical protein
MTPRLGQSDRRKQSPVPGGRPHRVRVQLTTEQLQELRQLARDLDIGIPEILVSSALDGPKAAPQAVMNEIAGIRQVLNDESLTLRRIADAADRNGWDPEHWDDVVKAIHERDLRLAEFLGW